MRAKSSRVVLTALSAAAVAAGIAVTLGTATAQPAHAKVYYGGAGSTYISKAPHCDPCEPPISSVTPEVTANPFTGGQGNPGRH